MLQSSWSCAIISDSISTYSAFTTHCCYRKPHRAEVRHCLVAILLSETVTCASEAFTTTLLVDCSLLVDFHCPLLLSKVAKRRQRIVPKLDTVQLLPCCQVTDSVEASSINAYVVCRWELRWREWESVRARVEMDGKRESKSSDEGGWERVRRRTRVGKECESVRARLTRAWERD